MPKLQLNGSPGEVYTNDTGKILYQFHCQFGHSCGVCISYHMAIGTSFPIPLHRGCNCTQTPIFPGQSGEPFVDFREMIREMDPAEQAAVMGRSNLQLVESGVVKYEDVVTKTRVRDLREVVSRGKLTVEEMVDAGVGRRQAERAYETVHTPAHELADAKRRELIDALRGKGIADDAIRRAVSERIALRIGIGEGPSGPGGLDITPTTPKPPRPKPPKKPVPAPAPTPAEKVTAARDAQRAKNAEAASRDPAYSSLQSRFPDLIPPGPIEDRLKAYTLGDAKVDAVIAAEEAAAKRLDALYKEKKKLDLKLSKSIDQQARMIDKYERKGLPVPDDIAESVAAMGREADATAAREKEVLREILALQKGARDRVAAILAVDRPIDVFSTDVALGTVGNQGSLDAPTANNRSALAKVQDWLGRLVARGDATAIATSIGERPDARAYFLNGHHMQIAVNEAEKTIAHEFGHVIEDQVLTGGVRVRDLSRQFLDYRVGNEPLVSLKDKFGEGYDAWEMGRKDRFDAIFPDESSAYYTGKHYASGEYTEILPMGMQLLYNDPVKFAKTDREYFKFVIGILDGSLR